SLLVPAPARAVRRVALPDLGVVGGVRVAPVGAGVAAVAAVGIAALSGRVAALSLCLGSVANPHRNGVVVDDLLGGAATAAVGNRDVSRAHRDGLAATGDRDVVVLACHGRGGQGRRGTDQHGDDQRHETGDAFHHLLLLDS